MTDEDDAMQKHVRPKRKIGCLMQGIIAFLLLVAILATAFFLWHAKASGRYRAAVAKLKAAGYATTPDELQSQYGPAPEPNSGPLWIQAGKTLLEDTAADTQTLPFIGAEYDQDDPVAGQPFPELEACKAYLERHAEDLDLVRTAARNPNPPRYYEQIIGSPPGSNQRDFIQGHRHIARVLRLLALVQAHEGDMEGLVDTLQLSLRVGTSLVEEPTLFGQLVSKACSQTILIDLPKYVAMDLTNDQLARLQETLREADPLGSLRCGLQGELVSSMSFFKDPAKRGPLPRYEDSAYLVENVSLLLEAAETKDWAVISKQANEIETEIEGLNEQPANAVRYAFSANSLNAFVTFAKTGADWAATLRVNDALIAARRYQLQNQKVPETLELLVPEFLPAVLTDPHSPTNAPVRWDLKPNELTIYSVGTDQTDDGGNEKIDKASGRPRDVVVRLSR